MSHSIRTLTDICDDLDSPGNDAIRRGYGRADRHGDDTMSDQTPGKLSPKAEPVTWATIVGLVIAAAASYGLNITSELAQALVVVVPMLIAAFVARANVTPVSRS